MASLRLSSSLRLAALSLLFAAGGSRVLAQEAEKPDAPTPHFSDENGSTASPQGSSKLPVYNHQAAYQPISGQERARWVFRSTLGAKSLLGGVFFKGISTARNSPEEYGPHWDGFGKRYGMWLSAVAASHSLEAGLGAIWGEDPRYVRSGNPGFKQRLGHIFVMTFAARNRAGELKPAYARYIAIPGSNFLTNTWRVESDSQSSDALRRSAYSFAGKLAGNALSEFWPDLKRKVLKK